MGTAKGSAKLGQQVHFLSSRGREKCVYRLIERGSIQIRARLGKPIHLCVKDNNNDCISGNDRKQLFIVKSLDIGIETD